MFLCVSTATSNVFHVFHQVKDIDGFVCLIHGKEEDEDYKINRQLTKTLDIFNHEVRKYTTDRWVFIKEALYIIWCGANRLGDSGVNRLSDTSAFVNPASGSATVNPAGKTKIDGVGIVFEFYIAPRYL